MEWPNVTPIKSTRIYEEIVRQVKSMIAEGRLKSGDRLPPERDLAEKFVVSRTSVREALRALESLGLVEIRPGEGTFVARGVRRVAGGAAGAPHGLAARGDRRAVRGAPRCSSPRSRRWRPSRATPEEIQEMERILDEQAREIAAGRTGLAQDAEFHAAIGAAAHNRAITRDRARHHGSAHAEPRGVAEHAGPPARARTRIIAGSSTRCIARDAAGRAPGDARAHRGGRGARASEPETPGSSPARPAPDLTRSGAVRILRPTMTAVHFAGAVAGRRSIILALPGLPGASAA